MMKSAKALCILRFKGFVLIGLLITSFYIFTASETHQPTIALIYPSDQILKLYEKTAKDPFGVDVYYNETLGRSLSDFLDDHCKDNDIVISSVQTLLEQDPFTFSYSGLDRINESILNQKVREKVVLYLTDLCMRFDVDKINVMLLPSGISNYGVTLSNNAIIIWVNPNLLKNNEYALYEILTHEFAHLKTVDFDNLSYRFSDNIYYEGLATYFSDYMMFKQFNVDHYFYNLGYKTELEWAQYDPRVIPNDRLFFREMNPDFYASYIFGNTIFYEMFGSVNDVDINSLWSLSKETFWKLYISKGSL
ncbi:MAG: hypothetical protein BGO41_14725 [Clostridiales bacterium 38-18]|nr:MAG: hypothetical protein BGO41_14725 [Clostridiales bacterium 38-18]